jgi:nucleotide-binding universal stress UspA family protein
VYGLQFLENARCNFYALHVAGQTTETEVKQEFLKLHTRISKTFPQNALHNFYTLIDHNPFIQAVRDQVDDKNIDMIIMGARGLSHSPLHVMGHYVENVITRVKCKLLIVPENATYKVFDEVAFPTDFTLASDIQTLAPISSILNKKSAFRILHINQVSNQLNHQQQANKALLEDFLDGRDYSFHFLSNVHAEDAVESFTERKDIDLMIMAAKNLNYFKQILFHSRVDNISYHTNIPFLILHE